MATTLAASTRPTSRPELSARANAGGSSAIRDLLDQAKRPGMISLAGGLPDATLFPREQLAKIASDVINAGSEDVLQYSSTNGSHAARSALGSLFGVGADPDRIVVTTGSQQALDLIARVVVDSGDQVVVGDPDYLGALQVFRSYGADVRPIAVDADGLDTNQLEDELQWGLRPKCLYLVPHFHNPTGATMSAERRAHLNALSSTYGFLVIEDDPYRELYYGADAPSQPLADPRVTVQLRSTSKILAPGLRVGAMHGPAWLTDAAVTAKQSADLHTSALTQAIAAEALNEPWLAAHLAALRSSYGQKRDVLIEVLRDAFGDEIEFDVPAGGMFLWARFDQVADTSAWLTRCLDAGVCFVPGSAFAVSRDLSRYARLSFATCSAAELQTGVERMAVAL